MTKFVINIPFLHLDTIGFHRQALLLGEFKKTPNNKRKWRKSVSAGLAERREQSFLFKRRFGKGEYLIPSAVNHSPQSGFIQFFFRKDGRLLLFVRRFHFLDGKSIANRIVDVGFAHAALHTFDG